MYLNQCAVTATRQVAEEYYLLQVSNHQMAQAARAGQFFMLRNQDASRILRRPISLHRADPQTGTLEFYFEVKGAGTHELAELNVGELVDIQGPLGHGFNTNVEGESLLVIGGGMGLAPLKQLILELKAKNRVTLVAGGRNQASLAIVESMELEGVEMLLASDNGDCGQRGTVMDILPSLIEVRQFNRCYSCGPVPMLQRVAALMNQQAIACEVSLEERMACGVKACVGCSIKTANGMRRVCHDGPVFAASDLILPTLTTTIPNTACHA